MMEFMESMRRGVDRAGFEVDRFLRANRVRSRINSLRSQVDEDERQIGHRVVELYRRGELSHPELQGHCERVEQLQAEIAEREADLERINQEAAPVLEQEEVPAPRRVAIACPSCGAPLPDGARFCPSCGAPVRAQPEAPKPTPPEQPTT